MKLTKSPATPTVPDNTTIDPQCDSSGNLLTSTAGNVASGATDSGNPVKVGGKYNATKPTYADQQRTELQSDTRGNIQAVLYGNNTASPMQQLDGGSDGLSTVALGMLVSNEGRAFNGSTWDRQRNNTDITVLSSAARTVTINSADLVNYNGRGVHVVLDVTSAGTGSITITISGKDALGGLYYTLLTGAAVTTNSTNVYKIFPGATAVANAAANDILPRTWRVTVTHNNSNSITYSVSASVIL